MQKRGLLFFVLLVSVVFVLGTTVAQEDIVDDSVDVSDSEEEFDESDLDEEEKRNDVLDEIEEEYADDDYEVDPGITPDSALAFFDFDFGDPHKVSAEKAAEIADMIERGASEEDIRKAFEKFERYNDEFLENADPAEREEFRRNAAALRKKFKDLEEGGEILKDLEDGLRDSATAVEISDRIKNLCSELAELDPNQFYETCKIEGDGWQKDLFDDLSDEQRDEAKKFARIMGQCFRTSGQECACDEIPFPAFADACSEAAPLATACDIDGDESACKALEDLEMPELPPHLQAVFEDLDDASHARFENHMPPECEGLTPKECGRKMIEENAPEECRQALLDSGCSGENECRVICEEIMFDSHMPPECEGLGKEECADKFKHERPDKGHDFGGSCRNIENSEERLRCYDGVLESDGGERFEDRFKRTKEAERMCAKRCSEMNAPWDFSDGQCSCGESRGDRDYDEFYGEKYGEDDFDREFDGEFENDYPGPPHGFEGEGPSGNYDEEFYDPGSHEGEYEGPDASGNYESYPNEGGDFGNEGGQNYDDESSGSEPSDFHGGDDGSSSNSGSESGGDSSSGGSDSGDSDSSSSGGDSGRDSSSSSGITGAVTGIDNKFLDYYFN